LRKTEERLSGRTLNTKYDSKTHLVEEKRERGRGGEVKKEKE